MITPTILTISSLVFPLLISSPTRDCQFGRTGDPLTDEQALARFEVAVNDYVDLHRRLARAWPPLSFIGDVEQRESAAEEFRIVLRDARPQAVVGSFFSPEVADVFRFRLDLIASERRYDIAAMTASPSEEGSNAGWWNPVVGEPLPLGVFGAIWPIFEGLPALPLELEYRLVGRDLVLLDVHANMVVDVLELALPVVIDVLEVALPEEVSDDRNAPPKASEEMTAPEDERTFPLGEEFIGCLYGDGREL